MKIKFFTFSIFWVSSLLFGLTNLSAQEAAYQINSGIMNFGYRDSIFQEYSGDSEFSKSKFSVSMFTNVSWQKLKSLKIGGGEKNFFPAYSYGFEMIKLSEDSRSALKIDEEEGLDAPSLNMNVYFWSYSLRAYLVNDPFEDAVQPYIGVGWGFFHGTIESVTSDGSWHNSKFQGFQSYRVYGVQIQFSEMFGLTLEYRDVSSSDAKVSNDPFNQAGSGDLTLSFRGVMTNFTVYYKY